MDNPFDVIYNEVKKIDPMGKMYRFYHKGDLTFEVSLAGSPTRPIHLIDVHVTGTNLSLYYYQDQEYGPASSYADDKFNVDLANPDVDIMGIIEDIKKEIQKIAFNRTVHIMFDMNNTLHNIKDILEQSQSLKI